MPDTRVVHLYLPCRLCVDDCLTTTLSDKVELRTVGDVCLRIGTHILSPIGASVGTIHIVAPSRGQCRWVGKLIDVTLGIGEHTSRETTGTSGSTCYLCDLALALGDPACCQSHQTAHQGSHGGIGSHGGRIRHLA